MANYKKLEAWKKSMQLVKEIYLLAKTYPQEELYALTLQTKRAAVSIPCNIAEGSGRNYKKDTIQFLPQNFKWADQLLRKEYPKVKTNTCHLSTINFC